MRGPRVHQRAEHDVPASWAARFPAIEQRLDLQALQPVLAAAQVAGSVDAGFIHSS